MKSMMVAWRSWPIGAAMTCLVGCDPAEDAPVERCDPTAQFGRPSAVASLNTPANEEQAALSPDELTVHFSRDGGAASYDIYEAKRSSKTASFGNAIAVMGVNTPGEDREPRVTADGLALFATSKAGGGPFRVTWSKRDNTSVAFGALQAVPVINGTTNDSDPFISPDGRVLYFSSDRGGTYALYRSTQTGGVFSTPELVNGVKLDTVYMELTPVVSEDELTLYFGSSRPGKGSIDMYQAGRAAVQDAFGEPIALSELNTLDPELPSWISADGCELYFTRYDPALGLELAVALRGMQ